MRVEDALEEMAAPNNGPQREPPEYMDEESEKHTSGSPDMDRQHNNRREAYAEGGMAGNSDETMAMNSKGRSRVSQEYGSGPEEDRVEHPAGLEEDDDQMRPMDYMDEQDPNMYADGGDVDTSTKPTPTPTPTSTPVNLGGTEESRKKYGMGVFNEAEGGMIDDEMDQPEPEEEDEHDSSVAAAIMAKRRKYADGGQVDLDDNSMEHPNSYYNRNENAVLKENYDEDMEDMSQPMDSNEHADELEDEDSHDMVGKIMRKMKSRSPIAR